MTTLAENTQFPTADKAQSGQTRPTTPSTTSASPASGELMNRVVQGAHQAIDHVAGKAAPHVQRLEEKLTTADTALHEGADKLRNAGEGIVSSVRDGVRENPLLAVGAALALGLLLARITR